MFESVLKFLKSQLKFKMESGSILTYKNPVNVRKYKLTTDRWADKQTVG